MKKRKDNMMVKFNNDLYNMNFYVYNKPISTVSIRIFFAIIYKLFNQQNKVIEFSTKELKQLTGNKYPNNSFFEKVEESAQKELSGLQIKSYENGEIRLDNIFQTIALTPESVKCKVNEDYKYLFNRLFDGNPKGYSKLLLAMMNELSRYEQIMAFNLVHYRQTGAWHTTIEEFKEKLCIPMSYNFSHIKSQILEPGVSELNKYFNNLFYKIDRRGQKVTHLHFYYIPNEVCNNVKDAFIEDSCPF